MVGLAAVEVVDEDHHAIRRERPGDFAKFLRELVTKAGQVAQVRCLALAVRGKRQFPRIDAKRVEHPHQHKQRRGGDAER